GIAGVEGEIIGRLRIHLCWRDGIEAFRRLAVAFAHLRAEIAGPAANRVGLEQLELAGTVLLPDLELGLLLEQADQDRRLPVHIVLDHSGEQLRRNRLVGLGIGGKGCLIDLAASEERTSRGKRDRGNERAEERAIDQVKSSTPTGYSANPKRNEYPEAITKTLPVPPPRGNPKRHRSRLQGGAWSRKDKYGLWA